MQPGVWTDEEDALLAHWQGRVGNKWSEVAKHIPGKTGQQCAQRWRHRVNPNISREKWSDEEDRKLAALVETYGNSWAEISRQLPGRTGAGAQYVGAACCAPRCAFGWACRRCCAELPSLSGHLRGFPCLPATLQKAGHAVVSLLDLK